MTKKYTLTIEETISQNFTIEAENLDDAIKIAERKYGCGELVVDQPNLVYKQLKISNRNLKEKTDWIRF